VRPRERDLAYLFVVSAGVPVSIRPIADADIRPVAEFLHTHLNSRASVDSWADAMTPPWAFDQPNHGFLLQEGERIVGAHLALYSERTIDGRAERICNLAAWCVLQTHRHHSLRLIRALLGQKGYHFTDLSPSGNVVPLNLRLRFEPLETATALVPNLPWPRRDRGVRVFSDSEQLARRLRGRDLDIYLDHVGTAAAHHLVVVRGDETCYVIFRRDRRKRLPLFASFVHVSNPVLFRAAATDVHRHLLLHHRIPLTLNELRVVGSRPRWSLMLRSPRPKMYRSPTLRPDQIDYLYSELACVSW
jgi:hypothetical protein